MGNSKHNQRTEIRRKSTSILDIFREHKEKVQTLQPKQKWAEVFKHEEVQNFAAGIGFFGDKMRDVSSLEMRTYKITC